MKKRNRRKWYMVCVYVLMVAALTFGSVGCAGEESKDAKKESVASSGVKEEKENATKTDDVLDAAVSHNEDDTEETMEDEDAAASDVSTSSVEEKVTSKTDTKVTSSNTSTTTKKETSTKKEDTHTHSWNPVYKEVDKGHYEKQLVKEAWTEEVPQYTMVYRSFCNGCGTDITNNLDAHMESQVLAGNFACGGYTVKPVKTQIGTKTVEHPAEYKDVWVSNVVKEVDYYQCSCGAVK